MALEGVFKFSLDRFARLFLPGNIRGPIILAFVRSILSPLFNFQVEVFDRDRERVKEFIRYDSRKILFENRLNRFLGITTGSKIYLETVTQLIEASFFYNIDETLSNTYLYNIDEGEEPFYMYNINEFVGDVDFIVYYPDYLDVYDYDKLKAQVDLYKLTGTRYILQSFAAGPDPRVSEGGVLDAILDTGLA